MKNQAIREIIKEEYQKIRENQILLDIKKLVNQIIEDFENSPLDQHHLGSWIVEELMARGYEISKKLSDYPSQETLNHERDLGGIKEEEKGRVTLDKKTDEDDVKKFVDKGMDVDLKEETNIAKLNLVLKELKRVSKDITQLANKHKESPDPKLMEVLKSKKKIFQELKTQKEQLESQIE